MHQLPAFAGTFLLALTPALRYESSVMEPKLIRAELIVALDVPALTDAEALVARLPQELRFFKVGFELFTREGPKALRVLTRQHKHVFLDLKLHDIPRTVAHAVTAAGHLGVSLLTVHASGGRAMLKAAAEAAAQFGPHAPKLIAVTTLTSLNQDDFRDLGIRRTVAEQAVALTEMALSCGIDGLVTSVHEAPALRQAFGAKPILVTPGIRPSGGAAGDQKRIATPAQAVQAGANYLVVGRPITEAHDPFRAAQSMLEEIARSAGQA
jgi:orotidine-5'-phosphate decarboxylase